MLGLDVLSAIPGFRCFPLLLASAVILRLLYQHWTDPLRDIPGPWIATYTRLWLWREYGKGQFHQKNIDLHRQYGPVVRIAPKEYSIDDPNALRIMYGHGTKFIKGPWYLASGPPSQHKGVIVSIFSDRNPRRHAESRRKVANAYSLTALLEMEQYVDSTTAIFMGQLENFATTAKVFDMGHWLQCYAFDVIGEITVVNSCSLFSTIPPFLRFIRPEPLICQCSTFRLSSHVLIVGIHSLHAVSGSSMKVKTLEVS